MNATSSSTRKRHASSASSYSNYDGHDATLHGPNNHDAIEEALALSPGKSGDSDGGQRKTPKHNLLEHRIRRVFRRNRSRCSLNCIRNLPSIAVTKIGNMRIGNVALFVGISFKFFSVLYSWSKHQSIHELISTRSPSMKTYSSVQDRHPYEDTSLQLIKWAKQWRENKMPFHSRALYRREGEGMVTVEQHASDFSESNDNRIGIALVNDTVFNANEYRSKTQLALYESAFYAHLSSHKNQMHYMDEEVDFDSDQMLAIGLSEREEKEEEFDPYYAFDDDFIHGTLGNGVLEKINELKKKESMRDDLVKSEDDFCLRPSFYQNHYPTCNDLHGSISGYQWLLGEEAVTRRWRSRKYLSSEKTNLSKYLGSGAYRDAFLLNREIVTFGDHDAKSDRSAKQFSGSSAKSIQWDEVVFKTMRQFDDEYYFFELFDDMRKDAMVLELLTYSPRAANIYSYCAMSSVVEYVPTNIEDDIVPDDIKSDDEGPVNDHISPEEKLEIALEMAKCIAVMHGFKDGVIAHVDVQIGQFFRGRDGMIKLIDYNRAEAFLYDIDQDRYCKYVNGEPGYGVDRSPEENIDAPLNEKVDVYSLGNVFYSLLTGLDVFKSYSPSESTDRIVKGLTEPIQRYLESSNSAEASLAKVTEWCWTYNVNSRPDIFKVVNFLEHAIDNNRKIGSHHKPSLNQNEI